MDESARHKKLQVETLGDAERVLSELGENLRAAGIVLPSLRMDPVGFAAEPPGFLLDLGRCNLETAGRLVEALGKAPEVQERDPESNWDTTSSRKITRACPQAGCAHFPGNVNQITQ